jgi:hypothetical protein
MVKSEEKSEKVVVGNRWALSIYQDWEHQAGGARDEKDCTFGGPSSQHSKRPKTQFLWLSAKKHESMPGG